MIRLLQVILAACCLFSISKVARQISAPVKLVYSREDDMRAARYRPYSLTRAVGRLDKNGKMAGLDVKIAIPSVSKWSGLKFLIDSQAVEGLVNLPYAIPNRRVEWVDHDPGIPVHFWRAVGASHNPFVIESLIDDLAHEAGADPLTFRRAMLAGKPRHLAVLDRLAHEAAWNEPAKSDAGRGLALVESFGSIVGQIAEVRITDGNLQITNMTCVVDCGVAVNPGQIEVQMQSSIVYGLSAYLRDKITIEDGEVQQSNFHDFEPLRMRETPQIAVHILQGSDTPGGIGEPGLPPIAPAVANAVFNLTGKRTQRLPCLS